MKYTGIWIDKDKALIVNLENDKESLKTIESKIEHFRPHGGSGTRFKGGPQDVIQDSKFLDRENQQLKRYFTNIANEIKDTDALAIFGPAGTNLKLSKELSENHKDISAKIKGIKKADSMTDNQVIAMIKDFFKLDK